MRVLLLTPAYPPFPGGGERYVQELAQVLAEQGHTPTVLTSTAEREPNFWAGHPTSPPTSTSPPTRTTPIHIIRQPVRPLRGGRTALHAWRKLMVVAGMAGQAAVPLLEQLMRTMPPIVGLEPALAELAEQADVLHGFNISWEYPLVAGWRAAQKAGKPFVATPFAHLGVAHGDKVARNSTMPHQLAALRGAAAVLTLTDIEAQGLARYGVPATHLHTIGGGLSPLPNSLPSESAIRHQFGLPERYALFVGRHSYDKGAIHAARAAVQTQLPLLLIGQPTAEFDHFYAHLPAEAKNWARPLGVLDEPTKHALLRASDMLLLPSQADSFGIVLLEAWAHGRPVIGAQAGGIPGVVQAGHSGLLVPFGDVAALASAMQTLWHDAPLRHTLGANGRAQLATRHHWPTIAHHVTNLYEKIR